MGAINVTARKRLKDFELDVAFSLGNELAVLFGPSGAGKSMTLQIIAGLLTPDSGKVSLGDVTLFDSDSGIDLPPWRRSVGYVFQDLALFPHLNVMDNILYSASDLSREKRMEQASSIIKEFRLFGLECRMPSALSGGQRQRVAFARALMRQPLALLLDEPFSALDFRLRHEMKEFLLQLREFHDIPVVLVTHDIDEAVELADTLLIYSDGKTIYKGRPADSPLCLDSSGCEHRNAAQKPSYMFQQSVVNRH